MEEPAVERLLRSRFGLDPERLGPWRIEHAIEARARLRTGSCREQPYAASLLSDEDELFALLEELLVHEAWFFRHPLSFSHLVRHVDRSRDRAVRVLSAPCACGEEPYSIAIGLLEAGVSPERVHIDAVDISPRAIRRASGARFDERALRDIEDALRERYFSRLPDGRWEVREDVRRLVVFHRANILAQVLPLGGTYDVVFARNLLIYLDTAARAVLARRVAALMARHGVLYVGQSEIPAFEAEGFEVLDHAALVMQPSGGEPRA